MTAEMTRRRFGAIAGSALASLALGEACRLQSEPSPGGDGRLTARPVASDHRSHRAEEPAQSGSDSHRASGSNTQVVSPAKSGPLGLERGRDATLHLPPNAAGAPLPLLVLLHGAGGSGEGVLRRVAAAADEAGVGVLAPDSRGSTWDAIRDSFGADVVYVNRAVQRVFDTVPIDPARVAVGGFSDGATYALSLGLINGDLFQRIAAFSPGFLVDGAPHGKPYVFISHGTSDPILPIEQSSRLIVPVLRRRGYEVTYREFDGGHQVPADVARDAMQWVAKGAAS
jgi:predicted esterase